MVKTTRAQREALLNLYNRALNSDHPETRSYKEFRKTVIPGFMNEYIMIPWAGMWIGIEKDGYTHS